MIKRIKKLLSWEDNEIPKYGWLYFDHLQGEFAAIEKMSETDREICLAIQKKRTEQTISWNDIHAYQLIILKYQDFETLKSKIISLRIKYQSLVDIAEYNNYITMRGVDFSKTSTDADIEKLRADYKYLLDEFYLRYAYAASHEDLRTNLLRFASLSTLIFLLLAIVVGLFAAKSAEMQFEAYSFRWYAAYLRDYFSTLFVVIFAGAMGAFVSMQQRFQSASNQGDPIYSLSLLTHGWFSIFMSPISGGIFAVLLYLFFASELLKGTIFPVIHAAPGEEKELMGLTNFAINTGPADGKAFALLIIWSFVAGFAERFVPDNLMRIVNQKKTSETAST